MRDDPIRKALVVLVRRTASALIRWADNSDAGLQESVSLEVITSTFTQEVVRVRSGDLAPYL